MMRRFEAGGVSWLKKTLGGLIKKWLAYLYFEASSRRASPFKRCAGGHSAECLGGA